MAGTGTLLANQITVFVPAARITYVKLSGKTKGVASNSKVRQNYTQSKARE